MMDTTTEFVGIEQLPQQTPYSGHVWGAAQSALGLLEAMLSAEYASDPVRCREVAASIVGRVSVAWLLKREAPSAALIPDEVCSWASTHAPEPVPQHSEGFYLIPPGWDRRLETAVRAVAATFELVTAHVLDEDLAGATMRAITGIAISAAHQATGKDVSLIPAGVAEEATYWYYTMIIP